MARITFEEPPPLSLTLSMTTLRSITGIVVIAYGWQSWEHMAKWQTGLVRFGIAAPDVAAPWLLGTAFLLGVGLVLGWVTRLWSFGLLCAALSVLVATCMDGSLHLGGFEYPLLLAAVSLVLGIAGGGRISLDRFLFERARRMAIESDERWLHPPYVPATNAPRYGTSKSSIEGASSPADSGW